MKKNLEDLIASGLVLKADAVPKPEIIPTGSLMFDYILGGGVETRRITQFFAKEGVGKSVMAYMIANNALKKYPEKYVVLVDAEHRSDTAWISNFIEDMDRVLIMQPEFIEEVGNDLRELIKEHEIAISCVIVDSVGAANTTRSRDKDLSIAQVGGNAMGVGVFIRSIVPIANKNNIAVVLINQLRDDIGGYGPSIGHYPGGKALAHAINTNVYMRKTSNNKVAVKDEMSGESYVVGQEVAFKITKGKNLGKVAKAVFYKETTEAGSLGFDRIDEIIRLSMGLGIITKQAASYLHEKFPNGKIVGAPKTIEFLKANPEIVKELEEKLYDELEKQVTTEEIED